MASCKWSYRNGINSQRRWEMRKALARDLLISDIRQEIRKHELTMLDVFTREWRINKPTQLRFNCKLKTLAVGTRIEMGQAVELLRRRVRIPRGRWMQVSVASRITSCVSNNKETEFSNFTGDYTNI